MNNRLVRARKRLVSYSTWLRHADLRFDYAAISVIVFVIFQLVRIPFQLLSLLIEIPILLRNSPMQGFQVISLRDNRGLFLESYSSYLKRMRMTVVTVILGIIAVASQFGFLGYGVWMASRPTKVTAYSGAVTVRASYDITSSYNSDTDSYLCQSLTATSLSFGNNGPIFTLYNTKLQFSINSIPSDATVTKVELLTAVSRVAAANDTAIWEGSDDISQDPSTDCSSIYGTTATRYTTVSWNSTGDKIADLGAVAVSNIQTKVMSASTDDNIFTLVLNSFSGTGAYGQIYSSEYDIISSKPGLKVTYTLPPQIPTGMAKGSITTASIVWNWTDTATEDTQYNVHGASHATVTGCSGLAANSQTCTETGLSANTQYTRHPNVTDPQGNTDGISASAYTAIEVPAGLTFSSVGATSITAASSTGLTNLSGGTSGVYFQESVTGTNSGWLTVNSWTKSGLSANTQYSFRAMARNGDSVETGLSVAATRYTLSAAPSVSSARSTDTWYTTGAFPFINNAGWGEGGVQYYRYTWNRVATHAFTGTESTWSDEAAKCPSGACTIAATTLSATPNEDADNWYLHVQSYNGNDVANGTGTSYGPYRFDGTAPTISAVSVVTTTTTASISWNTGSAATSQVDYGLSSGYGTSTKLDNAAVISHAVSLTGLTAGTSYHYRVRSIDQATNESLSGDATFTTVAESIAPAPAPSTTPTITRPPTSTVTTPTISNTAELTTTADTTPTIAGTGPAGGIIFVVVDRKLVRTVLVGSDGKYFVDLKVALSLGTHAIVVRAKTASGQVSDESAPLTITVTKGGIGTTVIWRNITDGETPSITLGAVAPVNATVKILIDATVVKTINTASSTAPAFGFSTTITPPSSLSVGKHTISLVTVNSGGQPSVPTGITTFTKTTANNGVSETLRYGQTTTYTVQTGDSLWKIAEKFIGTGADFTKLITANQSAHPSLQTQPQLLRAGWKLVLPPT